jgi:hypothetical protein
MGPGGAAHPRARGREQHFAYDPETGRGHEWNGASWWRYRSTKGFRSGHRPPTHDDRTAAGREEKVNVSGTRGTGLVAITFDWVRHIPCLV